MKTLSALLHSAVPLSDIEPSRATLRKLHPTLCVEGLRPHDVLLRADRQERSS